MKPKFSCSGSFLVFGLGEICRDKMVIVEVNLVVVAMVLVRS